MKGILPTVFALIALTGCSDSGGLKPYRADFMLIGQCFAGSRVDEGSNNERGPSLNNPKPVDANIAASTSKISLVALPGEVAPFMHKYQGFRLLLINRTGEEIIFPACDSQVSIVCEARDAKGEWKPIEHCPRSTCGNSYHRVSLPAGHYWDFAVPLYHGPFKTQLRYHLRGKRETYSNEFPGAIDPIQFTVPARPLLPGEWNAFERDVNP